MSYCLIVDDSRVIRKISREIVESLDFRVAEAENGEAGLLACRAEMPDVILLDWNMPVMDGYSFLQHLRGMPGGAAPKVVFCTTENDLSFISRALEAGRRRIHHEAVRQRYSDCQISRAGRAARLAFLVIACPLLPCPIPFPRRVARRGS